MSVFARVNQSDATKVTIESEIELPTIKIPLPQQQISQPKNQIQEIKFEPKIKSINTEQLNSHLNIETINQSIPRPL